MPADSRPSLESLVVPNRKNCRIIHVKSASCLTFSSGAGKRAHGSEEGLTGRNNDEKIRQEHVPRGASPVSGRRGLSRVFGLFRKQRLLSQRFRSACHPRGQAEGGRLFGTVAEAGLSRSQDGRTVRFKLEDQASPAKTLWVDFEGTVPDTFKAGAEVIVEGGIAPDGDFRATSLMTKCPSKYQKENRG